MLLYLLQTFSVMQGSPKNPNILRDKQHQHLKIHETGEGLNGFQAANCIQFLKSTCYDKLSNLLMSIASDTIRSKSFMLSHASMYTLYYFSFKKKKENLKKPSLHSNTTGCNDVLHTLISTASHKKEDPGFNYFQFKAVKF